MLATGKDPETRKATGHGASLDHVGIETGELVTPGGKLTKRDRSSPESGYRTHYDRGGNGCYPEGLVFLFQYDDFVLQCQSSEPGSGGF